MKVLYYPETKNYVKIEFNHVSNGIVDIKKLSVKDCIWEATIFSKPMAIALYNLICQQSCYELSIVEVTGHEHYNEKLANANANDLTDIEKVEQTLFNKNVISYTGKGFCVKNKVTGKEYINGSLLYIIEKLIEAGEGN